MLLKRDSGESKEKLNDTSKNYESVNNSLIAKIHLDTAMPL